MAWVKRETPTTYDFDYYRGLDTKLFNSYNSGQNNGLSGLGEWYKPWTWFQNNATIQQKSVLALILDSGDEWSVKRQKALDYVEVVAKEASKGNPEYTGLLGQYRGVLETVAVIGVVGLIAYGVFKFMPKTAVSGLLSK